MQQKNPSDFELTFKDSNLLTELIKNLTLVDIANISATNKLLRSRLFNSLTNLKQAHTQTTFFFAKEKLSDASLPNDPSLERLVKLLKVCGRESQELPISLKIKILNKEIARNKKSPNILLNFRLAELYWFLYQQEKNTEAKLDYLVLFFQVFPDQLLNGFTRGFLYYLIIPIETMFLNDQKLMEKISNLKRMVNIHKTRVTSEWLYEYYKLSENQTLSEWLQQIRKRKKNYDRLVTSESISSEQERKVLIIGKAEKLEEILEILSTEEMLECSDKVLKFLCIKNIEVLFEKLKNESKRKQIFHFINELPGYLLVILIANPHLILGLRFKSFEKDTLEILGCFLQRNIFANPKFTFRDIEDFYSFYIWHSTNNKDNAVGQYLKHFPQLGFLFFVNAENLKIFLRSLANVNLINYEPGGIFNLMAFKFPHNKQCVKDYTRGILDIFCLEKHTKLAVYVLNKCAKISAIISLFKSNAICRKLAIVDNANNFLKHFTLEFWLENKDVAFMDKVIELNNYHSVFLTYLLEKSSAEEFVDLYQQKLLDVFLCLSRPLLNQIVESKVARKEMFENLDFYFTLNHNDVMSQLLRSVNLDILIKINAHENTFSQLIKLIEKNSALFSDEPAAQSVQAANTAFFLEECIVDCHDYGEFKVSKFSKMITDGTLERRLCTISQEITLQLPSNLRR